MEFLASAELTQVGMLVAAVATLGTVIGVLYRQVMANFDRVNLTLEETQDALTECLSDRLNLWKAIAEQAGCDPVKFKEDHERNE